MQKAAEFLQSATDGTVDVALQDEGLRLTENDTGRSVLFIDEERALLLVRLAGAARRKGIQESADWLSKLARKGSPQNS